MEQVLALPPTEKTDEAFLREVDEAVRQDLLLTYWRRWGRLTVGVIVVGLLVFAGVLYFQNRSERTASHQGESYDVALEQMKSGQDAKAGPELAKLASTGNPGYRAMARFAEANMLVKKKDLKGAAAKYSEIAGDTKVAEPWRNLALVRQTLVEFDTLKPEVVINRLRGLAVPDSPWFGPAGELVAAAYVRQGKNDQAGRLYRQLGDSDKVAPNLRQRASEMAGLYGGAPAKSEEKKTQ